jgi:multiple sugar transport system ATP-binding protein
MPEFKLARISTLFRLLANARNRSPKWVGKSPTYFLFGYNGCMVAVTLEHITKRFPRQLGMTDSVTAIDDLSFKIVDGDVLAILGPSGCGKSTLLRIVAGLKKPYNGRVLYDNVPLEDVHIQDRGIGMVFQEGALIPHWEAEKSVSFFLRLRNREHEVPERVQRISSITGIGIDQLLRKFPRQLSGGEKQRVSIARALTRDQKLLLFDEPFANLDAKIRASARVEPKRLLYEFPVTSIYVTHDQIEAVALAKRIAVMRNGKFEQVGPYQLLYDSPVSLFVAEFIGTPTINTFEGRVFDGVWQGDTFGGYKLRSDLSDGMPVTMGIRPQHIYLDHEGEAGVIDTITPYLAERYQLLEVWLGKERWTLNAPLDDTFEIGSTIYCKLDEAYMHFFDSQTGRRIG